MSKKPRKRRTYSPQDKLRHYWHKQTQLLGTLVSGNHSPVTIRFDFNSTNLAVDFKAPANLEQMKMVEVPTGNDVIDYAGLLIDEAIKNGHDAIVIVFDTANRCIYTEESDV